MTGLRKVRIAGTGSHAPEKIMTNHDLEKMVDTNDEWIFSRTGIRERRIVEPGAGTSSLCIRAARLALETAGVKGEELDLIIVGTITPDTVMPSTACYLQRMLNAEHAGAFDLSAACSGFLYALTTGWQFVRTGQYDKVLVIGAESLSTILNYQDRTSCILFGDGAGAAVLTPSDDDSDILFASLGAHGDTEEVMVLPAGGSRLPATHETVEKKQHFMSIRGREVYKFAVNKMVQLIRELVEANDCTIDQIDQIVPHQVNIRIIESAMDRLGIPMEKAFTNIHRYGNTSAASVPMALDEAVRAGRIQRGDLIASVAFGAGLTWGSSLIRW